MKNLLMKWTTCEIKIISKNRNRIFKKKEDTFIQENLGVLDGEGDGTPLQYSCLENPMDGGAWWAAVNGVMKSQTWLSNFTFTFHFHALEKEMATHSSVLVWRIPGMGEPGGLPSVGSHRVGHDWSDLAAAGAAAAGVLEDIKDVSRCRISLQEAMVTRLQGLPRNRVQFTCHVWVAETLMEWFTASLLPWQSWINYPIPTLAESLSLAVLLFHQSQK